MARNVPKALDVRSLVRCCQERRLVVIRLVENYVDVMVSVNLHQMYYCVHLRVGSSARLAGEILVPSVVLKVLFLYIWLPSNHTEEDTGRLLWFSVPTGRTVSHMDYRFTSVRGRLSCTGRGSHPAFE